MLINKSTIEEFYQINPKYIEELYFLQVELLKLQNHVKKQGMRMAILFEGRDTAGKGAAIFRFTQFLNPREYKTVALGKPSKVQKGQWYFQRYLRELPNVGQMVFFDRSWYNRAVVEPAMGFCNEKQYLQFMEQVPILEKMLTDDDIILVKFWFSIDRIQQSQRIQERIENPLKQWKVSPVDLAAQQKWEEFTRYKSLMFEQTSTDYAPWINIQSTSREESRIQAMRYILTLVDYADRSPDLLPPDQIQLKIR